MDLHYETPTHAPVRVWLPFVLFPTCVAVVMSFGAAINVVNGLVSPQYFRAVMRWAGSDLIIWNRSIIQGFLEGSCFGIAFAIVYTAAAIVATRLRTRLELMLMPVFRAMLLAMALWVLGGVGGMALATLAPGFHRANFIGVPADRLGQIRHAWVGGSIWGAYLGGAVGCIYAPIRLHRSKNQRKRATA